METYLNAKHLEKDKNNYKNTSFFIFLFFSPDEIQMDSYLAW